MSRRKFPYTIAVDFDGTLCTNKWPEIGDPNKELIKYLILERSLGTKVILWTCRSGDHLTNAVEWCNQYGLYFDEVNENLPERIKTFGGNSRKVVADLYIDDHAMPAWW